MAKALAALMMRKFDGHFDSIRAYANPPYFVPSDTLIVANPQHRLGIGGEQHLFGGVVPLPFVATKVITHPLSDFDSPAPAGWAPEFCRRVANVVLPGYSAFSRRDALNAGIRLLESGSVRIKKPSGVGGLGQSVVTDRRQLESELDDVDVGELLREGIVLERNLLNVRTCSVGQAQVGATLVTYCGTQRLTPNNEGRLVYGGSDLTVARGDWESLLALQLSPALRTAIAQARVYHDAAMATFSGMFASRRNYDVAQGDDGGGTWRSGVLEQSWRIGGATGAEIAALAAFQADPALDVVRTCTCEAYGEPRDVPDDAVIYFRGADDEVGPITKYARIQSYGYP